MTFVLSKIFWAIADPGNLLVLLLLAGLAWLAATHRRHGLGLGIIVSAMLGLVAISTLPLGAWALLPLESRFPAPQLPAQIAGIVVLGGAVEGRLSRDRGTIALNDAAERIFAAAILARRHPEAKILISGGDATLFSNGSDEAAQTRDLLVELGIAAERVLTEDRSRNTYENAVFSRQAAAPKPGEVWLLVTSAAHMPRAVGCFRHAGWSVLPYPVDYRAEPRPGLNFWLRQRLGLLDLAAKEWIGLVAYDLLGRTDKLFPKP